MCVFVYVAPTVVIFTHHLAALRRSQTAFLALQISGGHIGLVVVLIFAFFSRTVSRDPTFFNYCITSIISSVVFSIPLYHGTEGHTVVKPLGEVPRNVCLAQAALTEGAQVMTACSMMNLVIQFWLDIHDTFIGNPNSMNGIKRSSWTTYVLLVTPYILLVAFAYPSIFVGKDPVDFKGAILNRVVSANFYCTMIKFTAFQDVVYGVTLALIMVTAVFDVLIIGILYKHWRAFRFIETTSPVSLSILLRFIVFSSYRIVVAVAYGTLLDKLNSNGFVPITTVFHDDSTPVLFIQVAPIWIDMLQAATPLVAFIVFGLNSAMIDSVMIWRRPQARYLPPVQQHTVGNSRVGALSHALDDQTILEAETNLEFVPVQYDLAETQTP
ncbi:hypothetical protein JB92DRAFT_1264028 [Gautieria morchelliformis]|nr:hypothetical protein JB92DRAFT_1264028 [Gautieria morchelliformis]